MAGRVSQGKQGLYLNNPSFETRSQTEETGSLSASRVAGLMPVYEETAGLSSKWLRGLVRPLLAAYKKEAKEFLPLEILQRFKLLPLSQAIWQIHFPDSLELSQKARERLAFEELFLIELFILKERVKILQTKASPMAINLSLIKKFVGHLPFKLTDAQRKAAWRILKDLEKSHPMNRLLEGEVGSGKTVVAALAALNCARAGFQVALMAPTEILAKQHFQEVAKMLFPFKLTLALLTGKDDKIMSKKLKGEALEASRQKIIKGCREGEIDVLIGTHALIQDKVKFEDLGLVIIDEQHRFGVEQRARLCQPKLATAGKQNYLIPHLLTMTATPIPRSLALTIYGDLDLSIIDELPLGRKKITTEIIPPAERQGVYDFIQDQVELGRQAFVICPRIKKGEKITTWSDVKMVTEEKERLAKEIFPNLRVEMLHGQMKPKEKEKIMRDFRNDKIKILVATSVVEVGLDIPNASVMVVEGADRFGLAQLHQLRGRVGRSEYQSHCFLLTESSTKKTRARLEAMVKSQDGFELSQRDLQIRGPGQFAGRRQWGLADLAMASLKDFQLVENCKAAAKEILAKDITLKNHLLLKERLNQFSEKIRLG
jgi:ATP-dependent DNA helicase RecG